MASNPIDFTSFVYDGGYGVVEVDYWGEAKWVSNPAEITLTGPVGPPERPKSILQAPPGYYLASDWRVPEPENARVVKPLEEDRALFLQYGNLLVTMDAILAFANRWGLLRMGPENSPFIELKPRNRPVDKIRTPAEPIAHWAYFIRLMNFHVSLWKMIQNRDEAGLARHFHWLARDKLQFITPPSGLKADAGVLEFFEDNDGDPDLMEALGYKVGDVFEPAAEWLQDSVNSQLQSKSSYFVIWDRRTQDWSLNMQHSGSLADALWLQFAAAMAGGMSFKECSECQKWFEFGTTSARYDKVYCSNACRMRAYRQRKSQRSP